ncbi:MAG: STAS/SEC14 domain-containing protein [Caulobacteraceae bacterium]
MISTLSGFADDIVAVSCSGHVTKGDYERVLIPAVEAALKSNRRVRLYYHIGADFEGIAPGAIWEDFSIGMEHLLSWERLAVVADVVWIRHTIQTFGFLMPGKLRVFSLKDQAQARAWIAER